MKRKNFLLIDEMNILAFPISNLYSPYNQYYYQIPREGTPEIDDKIDAARLINEQIIIEKARLKRLKKLSKKILSQ